MEHLAALSSRIETVFRTIATTRMDGVPILNADLGVAMRGLRRHDAHFVGVLVTPWFMNVIFLPLEQPCEKRRVGSGSKMTLPSGVYDAIWCYEEELGGYWSVSLFSPMFEFKEMEFAVETADVTLDLLFTKLEAPEREELCEAIVAPSQPRSAETRVAEEEAEQARLAAELEEPDAKRDDERSPEQLDRRALFGLRRGERERAE